ncbi:MAG: glycosyl hydrolase family 88 [Bacilli bacterium]|nr:glycosyl hydrolase family 88 [Bacilli bacterium]
MWKLAIEDAVRKTRQNIKKHREFFPHITEGKGYQWSENTDWIEGFYTGIIWLCYEYTQDEFFSQSAKQQVENFRHRLINRIALDHHDIGFLYTPSAMAQWMIEQEQSAKQLALQAADHLLTRWRPQGQYIQAWGAGGDPKNGGRIIIDCLMNLPLLYWASETTGESKYRDAAMIHADKSRRYLVRGDDSSYHTFYFHPDNGEPIGGGTHQGYHDGSTWTRGQAWGIYGFALSYRYTHNPLYLETAKRMARYFIEHLPEDHIAYWDFNVPIESDTYRDSSASAIAACGLLELATHLDAADPDRSYVEDAVFRMMKSLVNNYSTVNQPDAEGLIDHGSYYVRGGMGPDGYLIWGDYFYLEALLRLEKGVAGYWYERKC